jgi:hypothetical protein
MGERITPTKLEMLLRIYYCGERPFDADGPGRNINTNWLIDNELIEPMGSDQFKVTARGCVFVEALCALPLPQKKWVMP